MRRLWDRDGRFADRRAGGRAVGAALAGAQWSDPLVLGLPRGGVPVAFEVAQALDAELDVVVARKIGAPDQPELGVGAVTADGPASYDLRTLRALGLVPSELEQTCVRERAEARRREQLYRRGRPPLRVMGRDVVVVDDGLATGVTARAALDHVRALEPARLVFAAPVCAGDSAGRLREFADRVECVRCPQAFRAVGQFYVDFQQTSDDDVLELLDKAQRPA